MSNSAQSGNESSASRSQFLAGKLLHGGYVVTDPKRPALGVIEDGAVAIQGGVILEVGPATELRARFPEWDVLGSEKHVVIPGFVNSHHHGYGLSSFQLGLADDSLESWLMDVRATTTPIDPYWDTLGSIVRLIRAGVTTVLHVGSPKRPWEAESDARSSLRAYRDAGMRVAYGVGIMDQNRFVYEDDEQFLTTIPRDLTQRLRALIAEIQFPTPDELLQFTTALAREHADDPMVRVLLCPLGPQWCSDGLLSRVRAAADSNGLGIHTHCLESPNQRHFADQSYPHGTLPRLERLGVVGPHVSLAHGVWLTRSDIDLCAESGTSVVHNASSNLRLGAGILPATALMEAGVNVAMGTDGMSLRDDDDMFDEMRLVEALHSLPKTSESPSRLTSRDVFSMATSNGALPTRFRDIGTLQPGRAADAVLLALAPPLDRLLELECPLPDALLRVATSRMLDTVLIAGEVVLQDSRLVALDEELILDELLDSARRSPDPQSQRWADAMRELKPHVEAFFSSGRPPSSTHPTYTVNSPGPHHA